MSEGILDRVAAGDVSAVDECLRKYSGLVWSIARRLSVDLAEAEDAVQEIFIEVWRSAGRYDSSVASEATFIAMIARRRLIDRRRKRSRRIDAVSLTEADSTAAEPVNDHVELSEDVALAKKGLEQLRPDERRVLELSIYEGLSHSQIAETTALPLGTIKTHARRGLMRLRSLLGTDGTPTKREKGGA